MKINKADICFCVEDNTFFAHSLGCIMHLKAKNYNIDLILGEKIGSKQVEILEEISVRTVKTKNYSAAARVVIGQWGPAKRKLNQLNYLMHLPLFSESKKFYLPHGLEIKNRKLQLSPSGLLKDFLGLNYCEYLDSNYYFDTLMHADRMMRYRKYLGSRVLKSPTFFSIHTPEIAKIIKKLRKPYFESLYFLPKIEHIGTDKFVKLVSNLSQSQDTFVVHPREYKKQALLLSERNIKFTKNIDVLDIFNCQSVTDFGTSISAVAKLLGKRLNLKNLSDYDLIFETKYWEIFNKNPENFQELENDLQKYL